MSIRYLAAAFLIGCSGPEFRWQESTLTSDAATVVTRDGGMIVGEASINVSQWRDGGPTPLEASPADAIADVKDSGVPDSTSAQPAEAGKPDKCVLVPGAWECELTVDGRHHMACCQDGSGTWRCC